MDISFQDLQDTDIGRHVTQLRKQHSSEAVRSLRQREQRERKFDSDDKLLASARKRLRANYKEAENAKKQRTIQVMDIHEIPKPKNSFIAKNKSGGSGSHTGRRW